MAWFIALTTSTKPFRLFGDSSNHETVPNHPGCVAHVHHDTGWRRRTVLNERSEYDRQSNLPKFITAGLVTGTSPLSLVGSRAFYIMPKPLPKLTLRQVANFVRKTKVVGECLEWQAGLQNGYGRVCIGKMTFKAHRIAYFIWTGVDPGDKLTCHTCDNPKCIRPSHLFTGTNQENIQDASRKGRLDGHTDQQGSKNSQAKLSEDQARVIKHSAEPNVVLARRYHISAMVVGLIKRGRRWSHI